MAVNVQGFVESVTLELQRLEEENAELRGQVTALAQELERARSKFAKEVEVIISTIHANFGSK